MQMRWRRDGYGIDAFGYQFIQGCKSAATGKLGRACPMLRQWIDDADQRGIGQTGQHTRMVAAHDAGADYANAKRRFCLGLLANPRLPGNH